MFVTISRRTRRRRTPPLSPAPKNLAHRSGPNFTRLHKRPINPTEVLITRRLRVNKAQRILAEARFERHAAVVRFRRHPHERVADAEPRAEWQVGGGDVEI